MKKFLFFVFLLIVLAAAYLAGSRGPDPTQWFAPPTPTPTFTSTATATSAATATATATLTPIPPTPTPVPRKKAAKKHAKKAAMKPANEVTEDIDEEPAPAPQKKAVPLPPEPPERKPICNAPALSSAVVEVEPNNSFSTAQDLGTLASRGLQVNGTLSKVATVADTAAADAYKVDPKVENSDLDIEVYSFTTSSPFLAVLDCYTHVVGRPNPLYHEANYQLEIYNESFKLIGSSTQNDPVESVEIAEPGHQFYVVVYGVDGTDSGNYRLTLTRKEAE